MRIVIEVDGALPTQTRALDVGALLNAGWAGRDSAAVAAHVAELRAIGVAPPTTVPIVFPVAAAMLTQDDRVDVYSAETSGEVEYVIIVTHDDVFITVGSDHTDRGIEAISVELSKRVLPNILARTAWRYADVADHVDTLLLRAWVRASGRWHAYQEAPIAELLPPAHWLSRIGTAATKPGAFVLFSGTVQTRAGGLQRGDGFRISLEDPTRRRTIAHEYGVDILTNPLG